MFTQTGSIVDIPTPELFYKLLPAYDIRIDKRRGVKIRGLWCDDADVLRDYRGELLT
ncbi:hypothetical protein ACIPJS_39465 [Streptomyces sp. NPDC086783]|uniref:hypothetical protein n=1 Tax=Streptomyces sp. NPDC086783 TaxID=3365758 RepID=UPI00381CF226